MKKTSKILLVLALAMFVTIACIIGVMQMTIVAHAENEVVDEVTQEATETIEETPTFSGRVVKWFEDNIVTFLGTVNLGTVLSCIAFILRETRFNKKHTKLTVDNLSLNTESNNEVVKAVNNLISGYNKTIEDLSSIKEDYDKLKEAYSEVVSVTKGTLEILSTVYANNKNLPQGIKDLVAIKYATALKGEVSESKGNPSEE